MDCSCINDGATETVKDYVYGIAKRVLAIASKQERNRMTRGAIDNERARVSGLRERAVGALDDNLVLEPGGASGCVAYISVEAHVDDAARGETRGSTVLGYCLAQGACNGGVGGKTEHHDFWMNLRHVYEASDRRINMIDGTDGEVDALEVVKVGDEVARGQSPIGGARLDDVIPFRGLVGVGENMVVAQYEPLTIDLEKAT